MKGFCKCFDVLPSLVRILDDHSPTTFHVFILGSSVFMQDLCYEYNQKGEGGHSCTDNGRSEKSEMPFKLPLSLRDLARNV